MRYLLIVLMLSSCQTVKTQAKKQLVKKLDRGFDWSFSWLGFDWTATGGKKEIKVKADKDF